MFSSLGSIIWTLIIGIIVGALARLLLPGKEAFPPGAMGWLLTAVLGIVGAFIGTFVGGALWGGTNYAAGWIMSIIGAIVVLLLVRLVMGSRSA
ncbi:MAG: GlsB/YeaQ/YmgE family stress response membrane protein [Pyrinomonadaceae bacterium]